MFLLKHDTDNKFIGYFIECSCDKNLLKRLAQWADIFGALNVMNLTMHGKGVNKFYVRLGQSLCNV